MSSTSGVVLTQEQAEILLPLLPSLKKRGTGTTDVDEDKYSTSDMFAKSKTGRATAAHNYLLVSSLKLAAEPSL